MDDDRDGKLNYKEFSKALKDYRVSLTEEDISDLFKAIGNTSTKLISIEDFVEVFVGVMNESRTVVATSCFKSMDSRKEELVTLDQIKQKFTARRHPEVTSTQKTQDEVLAEFIEAFETHHRLKGKRRDHRISL